MYFNEDTTKVEPNAPYQVNEKNKKYYQEWEKDRVDLTEEVYEALCAKYDNVYQVFAPVFTYNEFDKLEYYYYEGKRGHQLGTIGGVCHAHTSDNLDEVVKWMGKYKHIFLYEAREGKGVRPDSFKPIKVYKFRYGTCGQYSKKLWEDFLL